MTRRCGLSTPLHRLIALQLRHDELDANDDQSVADEQFEHSPPIVERWRRAFRLPAASSTFTTGHLNLKHTVFDTNGVTVARSRRRRLYSYPQTEVGTTYFHTAGR